MACYRAAGRWKGGGMSTEPDTGNKELVELLAPYMEQPIVTPQMLQAGLQYLIGYLTAEIERRTPKHCAAWMTVTELAAYFGYHRVTMHRVIAPYIENGRVHVIQIPAYGGKKQSSRKYCLSDVLSVLTPGNSGQTGKP